MKETSCRRAEAAIENLGDGELGRAKRLLLKRHAERCSRCGSYLGRMEAVLSTLDELRRVAAPDDLLEAVMTRLLSGAAPAEQKEYAQVGVHGRRNLILVIIGAVLGVAIAVTLAVLRWLTGREREEGLATLGSA